MKNVNSILVVGGGSAGWMTASTLIHQYPEKKISLIESPTINTIGVGESTIGSIKRWTNFLGIDDKDFFKHTDAIYKLSIRFENFYKLNDGGFHYPFGQPIVENNRAKFNDWYLKKFLYPETPNSDYANCLYPQMALVNNNKLFDEADKDINFSWNDCVSYQFDATKFAIFLKNHYCIPRGVNHILEDIVSVEQNNDGIISLNKKYSADLYIDCTGFKSLLLGESLKEPFESLSDLLPNNSAWATKLPYKDKVNEMVGYTNCTAYNNGWIWNIPLWSRIGTGYVYSDKFIDDDNALKEFQKYLKTDELEFKKIKMRVGIHKRLWVKNVVAIGLSAGFIEPLESNGLFTVHEFLMKFIRNTQRDIITEWDRENFNYQCINQFKKFADFVAIHYALSNRNDTEYWISNNKKKWKEKFCSDWVQKAIEDRTNNFEFNDGGLHCIATGMNWYPTELSTIKYFTGLKNFNELKNTFQYCIDNLNIRKDMWNNKVKDKMSFYDFHKFKFYNK
jgi:hypothetical protein